VLFSIHPELLELKRISQKKRSALEQHNKKLRELLADEISLMSCTGVSYARIDKQVKSIRNNRMRCTQFIVYLSNTKHAINNLVNGCAPVTLSKIEDLVTNYPEFIEHLFEPDGKDNKKNERTSYITEHLSRLSLVGTCTNPGLRTMQSVLVELLPIFNRLLNNIEFSEGIAQKLVEQDQSAEKDYELGRVRIERDLKSGARVYMSTIGSSHKLPARRVKKVVEDDDSSDDEYDFMASIYTDEEEGEDITMRPTFVVFDEAGCIPAYELLGLSRVRENIVGVLCVGDKNQLPPFISTTSQPTKSNGNGNWRQSNVRVGTSQEEKSIKSILDVSKMVIDKESKVKLTQQYRVPRDIAEILNLRVYRGDYSTVDSTKIPVEGFLFVNVPCKGEKVQYVNKEECSVCNRILQELRDQNKDEVIVLTPVSLR
jgi:hypothetical protein